MGDDVYLQMEHKQTEKCNEMYINTATNARFKKLIVRSKKLIT